MRIVVSCLLLSAISFISVNCSNQKDKKLDNTTSGAIKITVDESLRPLFETEIDTFEGIYTAAKVSPTYTSEDEAIQAVMMDSARLAVVTRQLTPEEKENFKQLKLNAYQTIVAKEAVAVIVNRDNADSIFSVDDLKLITEGKISQWSQINPKTRLKEIEVVLDNPKSGIVRFLKDSVAHVDKLPAYFYALKSNQEVIEYVAKKPNSIGLIGVSWISDFDDSLSSQFLKTVRICSISKDSSAVRPYQAYIANHQYPLRRYVYVISREARAGLGTGFTAFVAGEKGQRIILKSGMVPATMPLRIVEFKRSKLE